MSDHNEQFAGERTEPGVAPVGRVRRWRWMGGLVAVIVVVGGAIFASMMANIGPPQDPPQQFPPEMLIGNDRVQHVMSTATQSVNLDSSAIGKCVEFTRFERETAASEWIEQKQRLETSFHITAIGCWRDEVCYVAGVYPDWTTETLERWSILHPPTHTSAGVYIPLDKRRRPTVRRDVMYLGVGNGVIRDLALDPENRFLLALTHSPRRLYRVDLGSTPAVWNILHTLQTLPDLATISSVIFADHVTEGRKYILSQVPPGHHSPSEEPVLCVFLEDPDGDGLLGDPIVLDEVSWNAGGYGDSAVWRLWRTVGPTTED